MLITYSVSVSSQATVSLKATDSLSGDAVLDYEVFDIIAGRSYRPSDEKGVLINSPTGQTLRLVVFSFQYKTLNLNLSIEKDTSIYITLEPLSETINEVLISAKRKEFFALRNLDEVEGTAIYSAKKTERVFVDDMLANKATNNPRQLYARVAGLNIFDASEGGLQLNIAARGLDPNRSANFNTRQNGYDISADILGYPESYYTPPAEAIQEIQLVRGAASLQYGTQFGGLVNFKLKEAPRYDGFDIESRQSTGSYGLFNSYNSYGLKNGGWSVFGYFNHRQGDGFRSNSGFESNNLFASIGYDFSDNTSLRLEHSYFHYLAQQAGGLTDEQFYANPQQSIRERNWFMVDWQLSALKFKHQFTESLNFSIDASALHASRKAVGFRGDPGQLNVNPVTQLDEQNDRGEYINPRDLIVGSFENISVEARLLKQFGLPFVKADASSHILAGVKYYNAQNEALQGPGSQGVDADFRIRNDIFPDYPSQSDFLFPNRNLALFSEAIFKLSSRLSISPGIRHEWIRTESMGEYQRIVFDNAGNPLLNQTLEDNRILNRRFTLFGLGISYKPSKNSEVYSNVTENYRSVTFSDIRVVNPSFIVDPDIRDESGYSIDLGFRGRMASALSWDLSSFLIYYDDRIGIIFDDRANRIRKNIGTARIMGLEALIQWNIIRSLKLETTDYLLDAFINMAFSDSKYLRSEENNVVGKELEFVPRYNLKAGLNFGYKDLVLGVLWTHVSSQFTDVENSPVAMPGDQKSGLVGPVPAYDLIDVSAKWRLNSLLHLEAGINNLAGSQYFTQRAIGYPGPGVIPSYDRNYYLSLSFNLSQSRSKS